jgi:hypothetical protein
MIKTHSRRYVILFLVNLIIANSQAQTPFDTLFQDKSKIGLRDSSYLAKNFFNNKQVPGWFAQSFFNCDNVQADGNYTPDDNFESFSDPKIIIDLLSEGQKTVDKKGVLYQMTFYSKNPFKYISYFEIKPFRVPDWIFCGAYDQQLNFYYPSEQRMYQYKYIKPRTSFLGNTIYIQSNKSRVLTVFKFIKTKDINGLNTFYINHANVWTKRPIPRSKGPHPGDFDPHH